MEARIDGRRGRGRPIRRWEQDINDWMDMTTTQAGRLAEDRILFRQKVKKNNVSPRDKLIKKKTARNKLALRILKKSASAPEPTVRKTIKMFLEHIFRRLFFT